MKTFTVFCLAVLAITLIVQIGARPTGKIQGGALLLLNNGGMGQQNESGVNITEPGIWNVVVSNNELDFEVCSSSCNGTFRVCYEGDSASETAVEECDTKCGFYVTAKDARISVMKPLTYFSQGEEKQGGCDRFVIVNGHTFFRNASVPVCTPKISKNGLVKLNVSLATPDCPVIIRNAYIHLDTTTSPPKTAAPEHASATTTKDGIGSGNGTTTAVAPSFIDDYWWIILLIAIIIIVAIIVGIVVYCLKCKKPKKSPGAAATQQNLKGSQSPVVQQSTPGAAQENGKLQRTTPNVAQEDEKKPQPSYMNESSILSHRSLLH